MTAISALKDGLETTTGKLVLLTLGTAGLYPLIWIVLATRHIQSVTQAPVVGNAYPIVMAAVFGWAGILNSAHDRDMNTFGAILGIGLSVLYIVWAFKARKVLTDYAISQHRIDPRMNGFYTLMLNVFYICYCINDLPNEQLKAQALKGQSTAP